MTTKRQAPPAGLGVPGRALWRATLAGFEPNPAELVLLHEACRVTDRLAEIGEVLADAPLTVTGSTGQLVAHPLLAEARSQARVLDQLVRGLAYPFPAERVGRRRSPSAREVASARWSGERGDRGA
jgi:hypothetical protein